MNRRELLARAAVAGVGALSLSGGRVASAGQGVAAAGIDYSAYRLRDGKLVMPKTPGFGFQLES